MSKNKNYIVFFSGYSRPHLGGIERYTDNLIKQLKKLNYNIINISSNYDFSDDYKRVENNVIYYKLPVYKPFVNRYPIIKHNSEYKKIMSELNDYNIKAIIVNTRFHLTSLVGSKYGNNNKIPVFQIEHGSQHLTVDNKLFDFLGLIYEHLLTRKIKKYIDYSFGVSEEASKWLGHFNMFSSGVWYNSINKFGNKIKLEKNRKVLNITYAGRILHQKGVVELLNAFKKISNSNVVLHIAGDGNLLEKLKKQYESNNIRFYGKLSFEKLTKLYAKTDIFVYAPNWPEGLPTSILEAGYMKCAIIASPYGGTKEVIVNNENGIMVETQDELEAALKLLINDDKLRKKYADMIYKTVNDKFLWKRTAKQVKCDIEKLINRNKEKVFYVRSTSIVNDSRASKEIKSLINNGYDVTIIGWDRDGTVEDYNSVEIFNEKTKSFFFKYRTNYGMSLKTILGILFFQIWLFLKLIKNRKNISILHVCDFDCGYISLKFAKLFRKKIVYDIYDYYANSREMPKFLLKIISNKENKIIKKADATIICSEWRKSQIGKTNPRKLEIIHNTPLIETKNLNKKIIKSNSDKIKICYVGILQNDRLIMEIAKAVEKLKFVELHIGGFGIYADEIKKIAERSNNIYFYGSLKYNEVLELENDCDILFATYNPKIKNHKYSAPNKLYEAMALGKIIIVCRNTGVDQIVDKYEIGFSIDYDEKQFVEILNKINTNKKIGYEISKRTKQLYKEKFNWDTMEKRLLNIYDNMR